MTGQQLLERVKENNAAAAQAKGLQPRDAPACGHYPFVEARITCNARNFEALADFLGNGLTKELTASVDHAVAKHLSPRLPEISFGKFTLRGYRVHDILRMMLVAGVLYIILALNGIAPRILVPPAIKVVQLGAGGQ